MMSKLNFTKIYCVIIIDDILVSDEVVEKQFVCDLSKCKGGCCEEGDAGAPLEESELDIILQLYDVIEPYLSEAGRAAIKKKGKYLYDREFGWVTPTIGSDREICAFGKRDKDGVIQCAFEQAYSNGLVADKFPGWKKPVSCHLFPVLVNKSKRDIYTRVNYEAREGLCNPACGLGKKLKVRTYEFLKEALIRRFGEDFYQTLDSAVKKHLDQPEG
jgi:hypothetical protein